MIKLQSLYPQRVLLKQWETINSELKFLPSDIALNIRKAIWKTIQFY